MIYEGDAPVMRYVKGEILPEGIPEDRRRSTYVHPIYSLDGKVLTDDFPKDHYHHRGLSWMWIKVSYDDVTKDLWTLKGIRQKYIRHEQRADASSAELKVYNGWFENGTGRKVIDETATLIAYPASEAGRIIDCTLVFAAVDTPVEIGVSDTGYSGLNLRFAPRKDTIITSSRGPVTKDENRARYAWADLSARFGESQDFDGITIFDHRSNPHFPTGWTLRFYGVLQPAFTSNSADYRIEPGKPLTLRYRLYVHAGQADPAALHSMFDDFNNR